MNRFETEQKVIGKVIKCIMWRGGVDGWGDPITKDQLIIHGIKFTDGTELLVTGSEGVNLDSVSIQYEDKP